VKCRIAGIIEAIERGIITPTTKERLEALEAEKASLERAPVDAALPAIHPNLAQLYRDKVRRLEEELADPEVAVEAKSVLRSLIKTIKITPGAKRGQVQLELYGELAAILAASQAQVPNSSLGGCGGLHHSVPNRSNTSSREDHFQACSMTHRSSRVSRLARFVSYLCVDQRGSMAPIGVVPRLVV
jgi:hypothetical protein